LINLSEQLDENSDKFFNYLEKFPTESISSNSAYEISKYLMKNYRYQESLKYAEIAVKKCSKKFELPIYESHRKEIDWFCRNSN
jgi:TolA-binding protein